jgi:D-sedoheptulose 7-phosphate isomerase
MARRLSSQRPELEGIFRDRILSSVAAKQALLQDLGPCLDVAEALISAYQNGGALLIFGNGGSAADAQHIAAEFVGQFYRRRPSLRAHALTVNTSSLTSIGNDVSYDQVFARQVEAFGRRGDIAIGISTSGNSANVVEGLRMARSLGLATVAMTGSGGGLARNESDFWVGVPATDVARIQESHILIGHVWSELVERALFPDAPPAHDSIP